MIQDRKGHRLKIAKLLEYPKHQQLYLELEESKFRKRGNYTVHLRFISKLTSELEGFYLSSYVTPEGEKRSLWNCNNFLFGKLLKAYLHFERDRNWIIFSTIGTSPRLISNLRMHARHSHVLTNHNLRLNLRFRYLGTDFISRYAICLWWTPRMLDFTWAPDWWVRN